MLFTCEVTRSSTRSKRQKLLDQELHHWPLGAQLLIELSEIYFHVLSLCHDYERRCQEEIVREFNKAGFSDVKQFLPFHALYPWISRNWFKQVYPNYPVVPAVVKRLYSDHFAIVRIKNALEGYETLVRDFDLNFEPAYQPRIRMHPSGVKPLPFFVQHVSVARDELKREKYFVRRMRTARDLYVADKSDYEKKCAQSPNKELSANCLWLVCKEFIEQILIFFNFYTPPKPFFESNSIEGEFNQFFSTLRKLNPIRQPNLINHIKEVDLNGFLVPGKKF